MPEAVPGPSSKESLSALDLLLGVDEPVVRGEPIDELDYIKSGSMVVSISLWKEILKSHSLGP